MANGRTNTKGFTLLELLVAMTLMVVTASCLYTALYTGFKSRRSALAAIKPTSQALSAIELLKQDIYGVLPPTGVLAGSFVGSNSRSSKGADADSLEFHTTEVYGTTGQPAGGIAKVALALEEDDDDTDARTGYRLVRRLTTNLLSPQSVDSEEQVLCRDVTSLNLRYFDGDQWLAEWDSTADANSLPKAVEIDITLANRIRSTNGDTEERRLVQSFTIPCGLTAGPAEEETESAGSPAGGAGSGGAGGTPTQTGGQAG
jgi:type II secretion system protein J